MSNACAGPGRSSPSEPPPEVPLGVPQGTPRYPEGASGGASRKPVKQHICCFYWLTRGAGRWRWVEVRRDFIYTNIVGYCGVVRLSVHKRFGWWHRVQISRSKHFFVLSRGLEGEETGEGTGICPRAVLCVACVRVLNGSFSASFLVKGVRTDVLVVVVVVVVETQKMRCWVSVKKEKE